MSENQPPEFAIFYPTFKLFLLIVTWIRFNGRFLASYFGTIINEIPPTRCFTRLLLFALCTRKKNYFWCSRKVHTVQIRISERCKKKGKVMSSSCRDPKERKGKQRNFQGSFLCKLEQALEERVLRSEWWEFSLNGWWVRGMYIFEWVERSGRAGVRLEWAKWKVLLSYTLTPPRESFADALFVQGRNKMVSFFPLIFLKFSHFSLILNEHRKKYEDNYEILLFFYNFERIKQFDYFFDFYIP